MNFFRLALRNIEGSSFRSWLVFVCANLMAGLVIAATMILGGARQSINLVSQRLGADMIVVPKGSESKMENAFLMGSPARMWMPHSVLDQVSATPGVEQASPQLFLASLRGASCCSVPDMFLIGYDPVSDFTLHPWLEDDAMVEGLPLGDAIGGSLVYLPADQDAIYLYGFPVNLTANLKPTGTGIDQSMFFTFETAYEIARLSPTQAERPLDIPQESVSAVMVKVEPGAETHSIAQEISAQVPEITVVESTNLFRTHRQNLGIISQYAVVLLGLVWLLSIALIGMAFSLVINERRREVGVIRALGSTSRQVLFSLLLEAGLLALAGGIAGAALFSFAIYLFRNLLIKILGMPFMFPPFIQLLGLVVAGLVLALVSVMLAVSIPVLRVSRLEPALAMRE